MKIAILEHPRIPSEKRFNDIANTPLWSCLMGGYAASALKQAGFETALIDAAGKFWSFEKTEKIILEDPPDLLCVNAVYFWENTPTLFHLLETLKQKGFSGHINLFGFFPTLMYRQILTLCSVVDSVAVGEFEHTLVELAHRIKSISQGHESIWKRGERQRLDNIKGLAIHNGLTVSLSHPRPPEKNPDIFAFPQRSSLDGTVTILGSRGCYNHCSFCPVPSFYNQGPLWRGRTAKKIALEMQGLVEQGVTDFYFADPNFIGPGRRGRARTLELMRLIKPMNIKFGMETRHQDLDDEILEALTGAGFNSILMGIESGSAAVLGRLNKGADINDGAQAIALCRRHGIEPEIGFLMFVPDSTLEDLRKNILFLMENRLLEPLDRSANLLCHSQIVLAGTSGYELFERAGRLKKRGVFGFEGEVEFADPRVRWIADIVLFACHTVLKSMSSPISPIYWKKSDNGVAKKLNHYLVNLFFKLLDYVEREGAMESIEPIQREIGEQINSILHQTV